MRLVEIRYDSDHPDTDASRPPALELPEGFSWRWCGERWPAWKRCLHRVSWLPWEALSHFVSLGYESERAYGWQPQWTEPIIIQPGETLRILIPMSGSSTPPPDNRA